MYYKKKNICTINEPYLQEAKMKIDHIILIGVALCLITMIVFNLPSSAETEPVYVEIKVFEGDSLWEIATKYNDTDLSIREYISWIKSINHRQTDDLYVGEYLFIPVSSEHK